MSAPAPPGVAADPSAPDKGRGSGLVRGAGINVVGRLCSQAMTFAIAVALSWLLGEQGIGRYAQAFAVLTLLDFLALTPFGSGLMRMLAVHNVEGDLRAARGTIRAGVGITLAVAALLAAAEYAGAPWLAQTVLKDHDLLVPLRLAGVALVPLATADSLLFATMGYQRMRGYGLVKLVSEPLARLFLVIGLVAAGFGVVGAVLGLVGSCTLQLALSVRALRRLAGRWYVGPAVYHLRDLCACSVPTGLSALTAMGLSWADSLIIGAYRTSGEVGVYQIATRIVMVATFVIPAVGMAFAPRITAMAHRGERQELARAYTTVTTWTLRLCVPGFVALVVFPGDLLRVFGPGYVYAAGVTLVLVLGSVVDAMTGPGAQMLLMAGKPAWAALNNVIGLVLNIALNLALVPTFGVMAAAWSWTASLVVTNLIRLAQVRWLMKMWPFRTRQVTILLAGTGSGVAGLLCVHWTAWPWDLPLGLVVVALAYLGLSALTLDRDDRVILADVATTLQRVAHPTRSG